MEKDFNTWNQKKQETEKKKISVFFKKREIWWTSVGENIGFEQNGKGKNFIRPVLIFKKFNQEVFWGIPLTTQKKSGQFYFEFNCLNKSQKAILSQLRLFDRKRLERFVGRISKEDFFNLEKAIQRIMDDF